MCVPGVVVSGGDGFPFRSLPLAASRALAPGGVVVTCGATTGFNPGAELITPASVMVELSVAPVENTLEKLFGLNADNRIGGLIVPLVPSGKVTAND